MGRYERNRGAIPYSFHHSVSRRKSMASLPLTAAVTAGEDTLLSVSGCTTILGWLSAKSHLSTKIKWWKNGWNKSGEGHHLSISWFISRHGIKLQTTQCAASVKIGHKSDWWVKMSQNISFSSGKSCQWPKSAKDNPWKKKSVSHWRLFLYSVIAGGNCGKTRDPSQILGFKPRGRDSDPGLSCWESTGSTTAVNTPSVPSYWQIHESLHQAVVSTSSLTLCLTGSCHI